MEIHWVHPDVFDPAQRQDAEARIRSLAEGHSDLIDVRITAQTTEHHRHGGEEVRLTCEARGRELVASRTRPDAGLALNEVLDAFEREVKRMRERRADRRVERRSSLPELGVIDRVFAERGYGFILTDAGEQVYFHRNAVQGSLAFEELAEGQRVGLNLEAGEKGPQATVVRPPPPDASVP